MDACRIGTIVGVSGTFGELTKELMTVASPLTLNSPMQPFELFEELQELWPLVLPI
jgi:hypothetical protein